MSWILKAQSQLGQFPTVCDRHFTTTDLTELYVNLQAFLPKPGKEYFPRGPAERLTL